MASDDATAAAARPTAEYDLLPKMAPFLDPHMIFPFLSFVEGTSMYDGTDMKKALLAAASKTCMVEYIMGCYRSLHGLAEDAPVPAELNARLEAVEAENVKLSEDFAPIRKVLDDPETMSAFIAAKSFTPQGLADAYGITADNIAAIKRWAKHQHEQGIYDQAHHYMSYYRELQPVHSAESLRAHWAELADAILSNQWAAADESRRRLLELIDSMSKGGALSDSQAVQQRSWLLHWSLYLYSFRDDERGGVEVGRETLLAAFLGDDVNLAVIQLNCPWLLRYAAVALLTSKSKRRYGQIKQLLRVVTQVGSPLPYGSDPFVDFLVSLLHRFDFEAAQATLAKVPSAIASDFFLMATGPAAVIETLEAARRLLFETYCRIHQKISLESLASKLHMTEPDAEKWLIDLIQAAELDAKIDSTEGQVVMAAAAAKPSVYQQVVDKTRDLTIRTRALADNVDEALGSGGGGGRYRSGY